MRSNTPIPGNPWPHDMLITVEDRPHTLLELLWIREAYGLRPHAEDLPPLLCETPTVVQGAALSADTHDKWQDAWPRVWHAAVAHAGRDHDPGVFEQIQKTANGSPERLDLLHRIIGPTWSDDFGDGVLDHDSFSTWSRLGEEDLVTSLPTRLEDDPERRDLATLVPAWRAGLTKIVTIPCSGEFTRRVGENALLMTASTRADSDSYRSALGSFTA